MSRRPMLPRALGLVIVLGALAAAIPAGGQTPKRGGILNAMLTEDPPGFSIHESATISGVWPLMPCYSNLVLFDPLKSLETDSTLTHSHPHEQIFWVLKGRIEFRLDGQVPHH